MICLFTANADMGAVRPVIPANVKQQLGLKAAFQTRARYADGRTEEVEVTTPIHMELEGRPLYEECLVLGDEVLIGQTALEKADLFVDCINGKLVPNPAHPNSVVMPVDHIQTVAPHSRAHIAKSCAFSSLIRSSTCPVKLTGSTHSTGISSASRLIAFEMPSFVPS